MAKYLKHLADSGLQPPQIRPLAGPRVPLGAEDPNPNQINSGAHRNHPAAREGAR